MRCVCTNICLLIVMLIISTNASPVRKDGNHRGYAVVNAHDLTRPEQFYPPASNFGYNPLGRPLYPGYNALRPYANNNNGLGMIGFGPFFG